MLCLLKCGIRLPVPPDRRFKGLRLSLTTIPLGLALTFTLLRSRQCPLLPMHRSRAQGQQKAHLLLLWGTEAQWGSKAACAVPPWPPCTLPVQCQPTFPLAAAFPALWRRADISVAVTFAGSPPGPSHSHSSHSLAPLLERATSFPATDSP